MCATIAKNADTVKRRYRNFRARRRFTVPIEQKHNLPPFLELNLDICSALKTHTCSNLNILSIKMMVEYLCHTILPEMVWKEMEEQHSSNLPVLDESACKTNMQCCGLTKLCPGTVYRWLKLLGFTCKAQ
jgi:hypothetical protein